MLQCNSYHSEEGRRYCNLRPKRQPLPRRRNEFLIIELYRCCLDLWYGHACRCKRYFQRGPRPEGDFDGIREGERDFIGIGNRDGISTHPHGAPDATETELIRPP